MADKKKTDQKKSDAKKGSSKNSSSKKSGLKKSDQKSLEKSAQQAYLRAKDAVAEARQKAKKLDKAARSKVESLEKQLSKPAKTLDASPKTEKTPAVDETASAEPTSIYTPPLPQADDTEAELETRTMIALRELAKSRGLSNYSQLNKAALVEKIRQG